ASAEAIPLGPSPSTTTWCSIIRAGTLTGRHYTRAMGAKPVVLAVDDDARALARIQSELDRRYADDYRVVCEPSAGAAAQLLTDLKAAGEDVAVVLADQWMPELEGTALLARARELHPLARRALLIDWGAWADRDTADAIFGGMARGAM